ncbi:MAG: DNA polymerase III subunit delta', partial [Actinomyces sp.]
MSRTPADQPDAPQPPSSVWDDVVGQESVVAAFDAAARAARSAVESTTGPEGADRADEGDDSAMTHAWLVTGPPGSGRSVAARAFAAALQCTGRTPGCGRCKPCRDVMSGTHPDVVRLATEKLLITREEVKGLIGEAQRRPWTGRWRVIL